MSSIKDVLFDFVKPFFKNQLDIIMLDTAIKEKQLFDEALEGRKRLSEVSELGTFVGKPVICISNEWETPNIGIVTNIDFITQAMSPVLVVKNYLDNQEYIVMGKTFLFTEQRFNAIFKLNPFELCSFIYGYLTDHFEKDCSDSLLTKEEVVQLLDSNGFYEKAGIISPLKTSIM